MKKPILSAAIALSLGIGPALGLSAAHAAPSKPPSVDSSAPATAPVSAPATREITYLGVALSPIPDAVGANLLANVPAGQGVMITQVEPGSPAARAGLSAYDIVLSYADQKLYSPRQLTALVRSAKAGDTVSLRYVHQGEIAETEVTLAGRAVPPAAMGPRPMPRFPHWGQLPDPRAQAPGAPRSGNALSGGGSGSGNAMEHFDSLAVQQVNGQYRIELAFLDADGVERRFKYEGNADEVREVIENDAALPDDKRAELLRALNMNGPFAGTRGFPGGSGFPGPGYGTLPDLRTLMERMGVQGFGAPGFWGPRGW